MHNGGSRKKNDFEARSHGIRTHCLRFAGRVTPPPRKTRFRLLAKLCRAGFVNPQGRDERFLCSSHFLPSRAFPDARTPTLRKRRPRALRVFEMTGGPGSARNERATGGWSRRWLSEIPCSCPVWAKHANRPICVCRTDGFPIHLVLYRPEVDGRTERSKRHARAFIVQFARIAENWCLKCGSECGS